MIGNQKDSIFEYDLSTAWDISTLSFLQSKSIIAQDNIPRSIFIREDGLKLYMVGNQNDSIFEYDLSTAWDISTLSILHTQLLGTGNPRGLFIRQDGLKLYNLENFQDKLIESNMSTPWNVLIRSVIQEISLSDQDFNPRDIFIRQDGLKLYMIGNQKDSIFEYDLSTAWDISTLSFLQSKSIKDQDSTLVGFFIRQDGLKLYVAGIKNSSIYEYNLGIA